jgi:hypothetical protein
MLWAGVLLSIPAFVHGRIETTQEETSAYEGPVYLAFAGPYSNSPASAFGHLFIVHPSRNDLPLALWEVTSFSADTGDAGALRFLILGITGGFLGGYKELKFHEQAREYGILEDRDLWLIQLRLSSRERRALMEGLDSIRERLFPYTYFTKNCAFYLHRLLANAIPQLEKPEGIVSPAGVMNLIVERGLAQECYFRPSVSNQLSEMVPSVPSSFLEQLATNDWRALAASEDWLRQLTPEERAFFQQYSHWKSLSMHEFLSEETVNGLARLRLLVAAGGQRGLKRKMAPVPGWPIPTPNFHSYGKLSVSWSGLPDSSSRFSVRYRPAQHEIDDPWTGYRPLETLEFLTTEVAGSADGSDVWLEEFTLFEQRSLIPQDFILSSSSWWLDISVRRGGLFGPDQLHSGVRGGIGGTRTVFDDDLYVHLLAITAVQASQSNELTLAPGLQFGLTWLVSESWRLGMQFDWHNDVLESSRKYDEFESWIRHDLDSSWGTTVRYRSDSYGQMLEFGIALFL